MFLPVILKGKKWMYVPSLGETGLLINLCVNWWWVKGMWLNVGDWYNKLKCDTEIYNENETDFLRGKFVQPESCWTDPNQ